MEIKKVVKILEKKYPWIDKVEYSTGNLPTISIYIYYENPKYREIIDNGVPQMKIEIIKFLKMMTSIDVRDLNAPLAIDFFEIVPRRI